MRDKNLIVIWNKDNLNIHAELKRKFIHLTSSVIPIIYFYLCSREQILFFTCFITGGFIIGEFARLRSSFCNNIFKKFFISLLREDEKKKNLTGATYLFLSMCITIYLFEKKIAVPALLMLTLADSFAAITGKLLGKHKIFHKSLEGSIAFFVIATLILYIFMPDMGFMIVLVALFITIIEVLPLPVNDNLVIPIATACFLIIL
jgi:dolichol kinase